MVPFPVCDGEETPRRAPRVDMGEATRATRREDGVDKGDNRREFMLNPRNFSGSPAECVGFFGKAASFSRLRNGPLQTGA